MSDTELTGRDSVEQGLGGREPLPAWNPAPDEPKTYDSGGIESAREAANDQTNARGSTEPPLIEIQDKRHSRDDRKYYTTVEDAAHDLSEFHKGENAIQAAENLNELAAEVDKFRATWPNDAQQPAHQEQSAQQAPPPPIDSPQPESAEQPSTGIDPDFAELLERKPQLRAQLEAPFQAAEQTRQAYTAAVSQVADVALSSVLANFPELQGISGQQLPAVLAFIQKQDPVKAQAIQSQLQQVNAVYTASVQAKAEQAQRSYAQLQEYGKAQDALFENATKGESKETLRSAAEEIVNFAQENGISRDTLGQLWSTQPIMRSSVFQQMMLDAAKYRMAQRTATANPASRANVPPVMRPGTSRDASDVAYEDVSRLRDEFKRSSGKDQIRAAVRLQQAQRAARR